MLLYILLTCFSLISGALSCLLMSAWARAWAMLLAWLKNNILHNPIVFHCWKHSHLCMPSIKSSIPINIVMFAFCQELQLIDEQWFRHLRRAFIDLIHQIWPTILADRLKIADLYLKSKNSNWKRGVGQ